MPKVTSLGSSGGMNMNFGPNWADVVFDRKGSSWDPGDRKRRGAPRRRVSRHFKTMQGFAQKDAQLRNQMLEQLIKSQKRKDAQEKAKDRGFSKSKTRTVYGDRIGEGLPQAIAGDAPIWNVDTETGEANMPYAPDSGGFAPSDVSQGKNYGGGYQQFDLKNAIMAQLKANTDPNKVPSLEEGMSLVPKTGPANLHKGEAVISAPIVKKVMQGEYPNGTTGTPKKPRDYKQVILEGAESYKKGTGNKKDQESILESVIEELFSGMGPGALQGPFFGGAVGEGTSVAQEFFQPTGKEQGETFSPEPSVGGPPTEDISAPEEAPFAGPETDIPDLMGDVTSQAPPEPGYDEITESVGAGGERKFSAEGPPQEAPNAMDMQKKQLENLNEQAQSMYTSAVTLMQYANERPNSPAAQYLQQQSQERMKASKQLQQMYQQGVQTLQAAEAQEAEQEAQGIAAEHDAKARETQAKYESEDRQRKLAREDRGESTKQISSLAKSLAGLEGGDAAKTEQILNELIMYYMQQAGGFQAPEAGAAGGQ